MTITTFSTNLREQREIADLDIQEVAELTGLPAAFIELLESGKHSAPSYMYRVSKAIAEHRGSHAPTEN
ncbi:RodZ family helix-turn-helix domain-containing protein [Leucobacter sp. L43]|uniref:helix-turn-helix domain-containing protein n=1 Tax=Leucobacter sp. L43 TaxID=2798040 RepID=UPI0019054FB3|nr:helix-turn-helix domain-containing protein [Leucobacter sp. L43]